MLKPSALLAGGFLFAVVKVFGHPVPIIQSGFLINFRIRCSTATAFSDFFKREFSPAAAWPGPFKLMLFLLRQEKFPPQLRSSGRKIS